MFRYFVLIILLTFVVFSNVEAHDQSCYYLHLDGTVSVSNFLGQRLLTGSALVSQIRTDAVSLGLPHGDNDRQLFRVDSSAITITGGEHDGTIFEITGGLIQIDKDETNGNDFFASQTGGSRSFDPSGHNHSHILYKQWTDPESGSVTAKNMGGFYSGHDQPVQCSNEGTYALWENPDYDPNEDEGPGNQQYLNEEYLPGGSKNRNPQDQTDHISQEDAGSQAVSSDEQGNSVGTQQQKSNDSAGEEGENGEAQQQKSNDSADGEGESGEAQQQKSNGDSEPPEQPSDDPSEEMPRSNAGNAPAAFAIPGVVAWQVVTYDTNGTVIRRVVGGVGQQSVVVYEGKRWLMPEPPPVKTELLANYPNPFNPETWIPYHLAKASDVQITIYDARGALVRQLDLGHQREGYYIHRSRAAHWDGRNAIGERVASGLYFYQLQADNMSLLRKMVILK